jgi:GH15 family glucan-1,4-alpha-glucosidase
MKIEDYGIIGDLHTVALVGANGSLDWLCVPRFSSDACFAALLGDENNGCWKIWPAAAVTQTRRSYRGNTLILETEFATESGVARLIDFMPVAGRNRDVVRIVEGVSGEVAMQLRLIIRFDYGRTIPWVRHLDDGGLVAIGGPNALALRTAVPVKGEELSTVAQFSVKAGERQSFVLTWYPSHDEPPAPVDVGEALDGTVRYWEKWAARCTYRGPWRPAVLRSLLTLKALTYVPTGGIVAAATTSLPEFIGGVRNWDYRYCWLRDATFTLYSFMTAGYTEEAKAWSDWLLRAVAGDPAQLQIMYGIAGERTLPEMELVHLRGYENSRPVRIGNAAAEQFQLDVYGEVMDAMNVARASGIKTDEQSWHLQKHIIDFVLQHWRDPDEGIWEIRGPRRHFTHSKVMAWVAMDRAVKAVEQFGLSGDLEKWSAVRTEIHADICRQGFNPGRRAFTQSYGSVELDASLLMMPLVGFLPANDPRIVSTVEQIEKELTVDGFVLRYETKTSGQVDGLPAGEGTFLPCSFWLADCLYLMGRVADAAALFERLLAVRSSLGLLAEEYDPRAKRQLGNVPQAFSHVGLVNTAHNLSPKTVGPAEERSAP